MLYLIHLELYVLNVVEVVCVMTDHLHERGQSVVTQQGPGTSCDGWNEEWKHDTNRQTTAEHGPPAEK